VTTTALLVAIALGAAPVDAGEHLLAGATAFRQGRFAEALVEFRVAEQMGDREAGAYAGAVLVKLGRHEEAIEALGLTPGDDEDPLLGYYRALALRGLGLTHSADAALGSIGDAFGPRIAAEARRIRAALAPVLAATPAAEGIDALLAQARVDEKEGRRALAAARFREAADQARHRPDRHRLVEAVRAADALGARAPGSGS
jgi:tetratricopeptide (TPR) repeat protein